MDVTKDWPQIRQVFVRARRSCLHHAFATTCPDGTVQVTPIGSLWLHPREPKGVYFDVFNHQLGKNLNANPRVAILAVDAKYSMWFGALLRGRFKRLPSVRLLGTVSERRRATAEQARSIQKMFRRARFTRGYKALWSRIEWVREITFDTAYPVRIGATTSDLF